MKLRAVLSCLALSVVEGLIPGLAFGQQSTMPADFPEIVSYWKLATNAQDSVGTNHGVVMGSARFEDQALLLNGEDSYINFGSALALESSFSMALWACPATNDRLMRVLGRFETGVEGNKDYCLFLNCGSRLWAFCSDDGSASEGHAFLQTSLLPACPAGEWHHLAMTWDAAQGAAGLSLYSDGIPLATTNAQISEIHSLHVGQADLTLGVYDLPPSPPALSSVEGSALTNAFQGSLSQLLLFRGVVPPDMIADISALGRFEDLRNCFSQASESSLILSSAMTGASSNTSLSSSQVTTTTSSNELPVVHGSSSVGRSGVIYVDKTRGNDANSGKASLVLGSNGPKKTVGAGLSAAQAGDMLIIKEGHYGENLNVAGRNISVRFEGKVDLSGRQPGTRLYVVTNAVAITNAVSR